MTPLEYFGKVWRFLHETAQQTGYPFGYLARRFTSLYITQRVGVEEFRSLHLYDYSNRKSGEFLTWKESKRISDRLNAEVTKDELAILSDKHLFNELMGRFIRRDWLYLPEASDEAVQAFLGRNEVFLAKPCGGTQGEEIVRCLAAEESPASLRGRFPGAFLLEGFICQHPDMAAPNPTSVNTIRFIAARHGDAVQPVGAGLRVGGGGQYVDNFHHGGVAYPIDLETGVVTGPGIDFEGHSVLRHPTTGLVMPGLQIPFWNEVVEMIRRAAVTLPHAGYVGWDVAVTPEGPELIEGNVNYPGNTVIQIDGPGPQKRLKEFLKNQSIT